MKRTHLFILLALIVIGLLIRLVPQAVFGIKVNHLRNQLNQNTKDRKRCEQIQLSGHQESEAIRAKLNKLLGQSFTTGASQTPSDQTATQKLDLYLSGTTGE